MESEETRNNRHCNAHTRKTDAKASTSKVFSGVYRAFGREKQKKLEETNNLFRPTSLGLEIPHGVSSREQGGATRNVQGRPDLATILALPQPARSIDRSLPEKPPTPPPSLKTGRQRLYSNLKRAVCLPSLFSSVLCFAATG